MGLLIPGFDTRNAMDEWRLNQSRNRAIDQVAMAQRQQDAFDLGFVRMRDVGNKKAELMKRGCSEKFAEECAQKEVAPIKSPFQCNGRRGC